MRILFPDKEALPPKHYLTTRSFGYSSWCLTFKEALIAAGAEVVPSPPRTGYIVEFQEGGKSCKALIDYTSHAVPFNMYAKSRDNWETILSDNCQEDYDFILALKYDRRHLDLYSLFGPVEPGGYIAFNTQARSDPDRWSKIEEWRSQFDSSKKREVLFCRMGLRNSKDGKITKWGGPTRSQQLQELKDLGMPLDGPKPRLRWDEYMSLLLTSRAGLNLPGWGNSICYRTLEYACIGVPIISGPELEPMILPWGESWEHEKNHLRVNSMSEVPEAFERLCNDPDLFQTLVDNSRKLFDAVFRPEPTGRWWMEMARKYLK